MNDLLLGLNRQLWKEGHQTEIKEESRDDLMQPHVVYDFLLRSKCLKINTLWKVVSIKSNGRVF